MTLWRTKEQATKYLSFLNTELNGVSALVRLLKHACRPYEYINLEPKYADAIKNAPDEIKEALQVIAEMPEGLESIARRLDDIWEEYYGVTGDFEQDIKQAAKKSQ